MKSRLEEEDGLDSSLRTESLGIFHEVNMRMMRKGKKRNKTENSQRSRKRPPIIQDMVELLERERE